MSVSDHPQRIGRYSLTRKLATGGMAEVFLAKVDGPGGFEKQVVLKLILPEFARDRTFIDLFLREAKLVGTFEHPNVAQVFDFGQDGSNFFLAMEFIDGPTLRQVRRRVESQGWLLPIDAVASIVARACEGLHYVHELRDPRTNEPLQLIHRDVSPDNIMLSKTGVVKVLDFGIVKDPKAESTTRSGTVRGKLHYMAPEQLSEQPVDRRVDVWALGIVLFELLTLRKPYNGTADAAVMKAILFDEFIPVRTLRPDVPPALAAIVEGCLKKDRTLRTPSARDLQHQLENFVASTGTALSSYDLASLVNDLVEGRCPRGGASTHLQPALDLATPSPTLRSEPAVPKDSRASAPTIPGTGPLPTRAEAGAGATPAVPVTLHQPSSSGAGRWIFLGALAALAVAGATVVRSRPTTDEPSIDVKAPVAVEPVAAVPKKPVEPLVGPPPVAGPPPAVDLPSTPAPPLALVEPPVRKSLARAKDRPKPAPAHGAVTPQVVPTTDPRPPAPQEARLQIRVLPEGDAELDGAPAPATVSTGAHTLTLRNKRFGAVTRTLTVEPCLGQIIVGYSFQSDKLSVTCRDL